ncbi:MAG: SDR family oxidoreductase [Chloroflexi bacterium]|nr:SDR family oxidoreductase [Chloroflexota bacterium]
MKVLFIGGTGVISSACSRLAVERGIDLYLLNRGQSERLAPAGAKVLQGDIRDVTSAAAAIGNHSFDAVVDWIAFTPEHVQTDIDLFKHRTKQYIFIGSASVYQKPPINLPVTESTPLHNPVWSYSQDKIACEERLMQAYRQEGFPATVVRPAHTYDRTKLPLFGAYTAIARMRTGKKVIVPGDGTSLWTLTHHQDFARGFVPLLGNHRTIGESFHITSDEWLSWNQIYQILADAAGVPELHYVHIPSDLIARYDEEWGNHLLGDKAHSAILDNSKIKRFAPDFAAMIPFSQGAREIINWFDGDPTRQVVDKRVDALFDRLISAYGCAFP